MDKDDEMILSALEEELERSMQLEVKVKGKGKIKGATYKPFFISYSVKDEKEIEIETENGSLSRKVITPKKGFKFLRGEIRVGDYSTGGSAIALNGRIPVDNDKYSIKRELWKYTSESMWEAAKDFRHISTNRLGLFSEEENSGRFFSKEKPVNYLLKNKNKIKCYQDIDVEYWTELLKKVSKEFVRDDIYSSSANMELGYKKRYFINSEGTKIIDDYIRYAITFNVGSIDKKNRLILNYETFRGVDFTKMPSEENLFLATEKVLKELYDLKNAPQQEAGTFPTLVDSENHGVIWHEAIGHSLEGHRIDEDEDGDGDYYESSNSLTFKDKIGKKIAPYFISVYDDPTDQNLDGHYLYDDEGVKGKKVCLVKNGILKNYLLSRESAGKLKKKSNGHARASLINDPTPRMSNIKVESDNEYPIETLRDMLIKECEKQGKEYGLRFESSDGGYVSTEESYFHENPKKVFRVYMDGKEKQVSGIYLTATPYQLLENIVATSDRYSCINGDCGAESGLIPSTETAPDALIKSLEIGRIPNGEYQKKYKMLSKPPKK